MSTFGRGDFVWLEDGTAGVIVEINWRDTCLRDLTGTMAIVPNTKITTAVPEQQQATAMHRPMEQKAER